jgi:hypothetical protein
MAAELLAAREANRWIPVGERLPTKDDADMLGHVATMDAIGCIGFTEWHRVGEYEDEFKYWIPAVKELPEPPEDEP